MKAIALYAGWSVGYASQNVTHVARHGLNPQKSVWAIVPEKSVKADGGKGPEVAGNTACKESDVLKAVARRRMSARG